MGKGYLVDSNAVIEFLGNRLPINGSKWLQNTVDQNLHYLSVINEIELLGFNAPPSEIQTIEDFVNSSSLLPLSDPIVRKTIELRRKISIKLPDAIIAATAIVHDLILITRNTADFSKISELSCINAHDK